MIQGLSLAMAGASVISADISRKQPDQTYTRNQGYVEAQGQAYLQAQAPVRYTDAQALARSQAQAEANRMNALMAAGQARAYNLNRINAFESNKHSKYLQMLKRRHKNFIVKNKMSPIIIKFGRK